ncbi:metalloregulator ArsR/SmtB family transcription factor [Desulfonatronospira sp.]|uniref:ArsR/SmtB family transcription factor n=1 Tax=Desulfonatronospira sp. TaxID=1962951 RepID=UPI0025C4CA92|nr:metalloregulator ArsR/SmtB family transcription factor [Desulfonatronospira sp.]
MANSQELADMFKVLATPARVRILQILKNDCLCVNALARELKITPASVSQHLRVLRDSGLVRGRKHGYYVHYEVDLESLHRWKTSAQLFLTAPLDRMPELKSKTSNQKQ